MHLTVETHKHTNVRSEGKLTYYQHYFYYLSSKPILDNTIPLVCWFNEDPDQRSLKD